MIRRIEALNYRCLRYVSQPLEHFHVLVGPNASGKSTFLDVLGLIRDLLTRGLEKAILAGEGTIESVGRARRVDELIFNQIADRFELAIELEIPNELRKSRKHNRYQVVRYEIAIGKSLNNGELTIIDETLWLCPEPRVHTTSQVLPFPYEPTPPASVLTRRARKGWRRIFNKKDGGYYSFNSESGELSGRGNPGINSPMPALTYLLLLQDERHFPVALWVRNLLMEGIHVLVLNSAAMRRPSSPSIPRVFRMDGSNLPLVVRDLRIHHGEDFKDWLDHLRTVLPDLQMIDVIERPEDRHLYLNVHYSSLEHPVPSWLLSDGTLRLLALTLLAYSPLHQEVYLIEEMENGIHPRAIEAVFESLSSVYEGQVLLATHSPLIVGLTKREQILCFAKNASGTTSIVRGSEHPKLKDWRGQVDLETLYAAGVLG